MQRKREQTMAVSMTHGKMYNPAKFRELTGSRRPPKYDPDPILASALQYAKHKTGLGYRLWFEFIRDFPKVRDAYSGDDLKEYDIEAKKIYRLLKHRVPVRKHYGSQSTARKYGMNGGVLKGVRFVYTISTGMMLQPSIF